MSVYRFIRGTLWRDDHPLALYAGRRRLSPEPVLVWWWPINWLVVVVLSPYLAWVLVKHWRTNKRRVT